jgi:class 3 adenylate cyclase
VVKQWVLPPVYERLQAGARFLAELRPTVPLFLKFAGIDYDEDEDAGPKLDAYTHWVQSVVQRHDGYMIQLTMGDKGSFLYASFGAPVAHDDDDERAVAAALELRSPPNHLKFITDIQIGISRGRSWAGECGAPIRHTYGVMGNEVNMAARMMSKAKPGQVLVRRRVAEVTAHSYRYEQLGLMVVKGGAEPIAVSELCVGRPGRRSGPDGTLA